ncbi:MAG: hypothetical protein V1823_04240 [Chloroflexota bacterium]
MSKKRSEAVDLRFLPPYIEKVLNSSSWINQADELVQASKKLEPSIKKYWLTALKYFDPPPGFKRKKLLQATYFMLIAYAIENYFKAVLVAENQEKYSQDILRKREGKLPNELKKGGHDLIKLVTKMKSNFDLTEAELSLLTRLFRHSTWQGRYPVPIKADKLNNPVGYDGKHFDIKAIGFRYEDINELKILVRRIKTFSSAKALDSGRQSSIY